MRRLLIASLPFMLTACGGWTVTNAQRALHVGAEAVQGLDEELAPIITEAIDRCDTENESREEFVECVEPYQPIRYGVSLSRRALLLGQSIVDAWNLGETQGETAWLQISACVANGLTEIVRAVRDLELDAEITGALSWIDGFGSLISGMCPSELPSAP